MKNRIGQVKDKQEMITLVRTGFEKGITLAALQLFTVVLLLMFSSCNSDSGNNKESTTNKDRTWAVYKADNESSNYSPLDQINTSNVGQLKSAWSFTMNDMTHGEQPGKSECNPIIIDGVMYASSANQWAYAIDAETGKLIWSFDPLDGKGTGEVNRGLTYWEDGDWNGHSILFPILVKLATKHGRPMPIKQLEA